jgi:hypothetical protein
MNIKPKKETTPYQKTNTSKSYKPVTVDWKQYIVDVEALIPYGKHINKTVAWLQKNDENYWSWLVSQSLLGQWGLVKAREVQKPTAIYSAENTRWVALQECPGSGRVCNSTWLQ